MNRPYNIISFILLALLCQSPLFADDDFFFALPSPDEILMDAESEGLKITVTKKNAKVLGVDLNRIASENRFEAAFTMGRIFSIAGFSFKKLNNKMILRLSQKMYIGTSSLELPKVINDEISGYFQKMLQNPKWERAELMIFFTSARSSLMYLMKDPKKVNKEDFALVQSMSTSLELGMWFQSLSLGLENLKPEQVQGYASVFIDEDILSYFSQNLKNCINSKKSPELFNKLSTIHQTSLSFLENEKITMIELNELKKQLSEVIK